MSCITVCVFFLSQHPLTAPNGKFYRPNRVVSSIQIQKKKIG